MANESGKTWDVKTWILGVMLLIITSLSGVVFAYIQSDLQELKGDFKAMDKKVDYIKEKVEIRDAIDAYVIRDIEELKARVKKLEER